MTTASWFPEFAALAMVHLLAVASPGPDFAIVTRNSLQFGVKIALWTSVGVGLGILLHVAYSLAGISLLISTTPWLFTLVKIIGAGYLLYIGFQGLRAKPAAVDTQASDPDNQTVYTQQNISPWQALRVGFLTNGLNVKATLFFLALFSMVISPDRAFAIKLGYGVYLALATCIWFCMVSLVFGQPRVRQRLYSHRHWIDRAMGAVLMVLGVQILFAQVNMVV